MLAFDCWICPGSALTARDNCCLASFNLPIPTLTRAHTRFHVQGGPKGEGKVKGCHSPGCVLHV